jgi:hypothetical protein
VLFAWQTFASLAAPWASRTVMPFADEEVVRD